MERRGVCVNNDNATLVAHTIIPRPLPWRLFWKKAPFPNLNVICFVPGENDVCNVTERCASVTVAQMECLRNGRVCLLAGISLLLGKY